MRISKQWKIGLASGMAMCWSAVAAPPPALDRVPDDAAVTLVMPSAQQFVDDARALVNRVVPQAERENAMGGLDMLQGFVSMPGMNGAGSVAAVVYVSEEEAYDGPPMVLILPVSDFGQFRNAIGAEGTGPVFEGEMNGESMYLKDIGGGFAAVGAVPELVQEFAGDAGHLANHVKRLGAQGQTALGANDVTMIANLEILSPYIQMAGEQMQQQMGMIMMMAGEQGGQLQPALEMMSGLMSKLADEGQTAVIGAQIGDSGLSLDTGVQFKDGTESFNALMSKGNASKLLNKLPAMDFMFAYAVDSSHPGLAKFREHMSKMAEGSGQQMGGVSFMDMMKDAKGMTGAMGSVPMMGAGMFSNFVTVTVTDHPQETVDMVASTMKEMDGQTAQGLKYTTSFEKGATEIAGTKVSAYSMQMMPDGSAGGPQMGAASMIMPMLFGPSGGPTGYMAAVDGAVVQTMSQNTPLMEKAIKAAKSGEGLGANQALQAVAGHLPDGRFYEFYLSIDQVMNTVGPMAAMMGAMPGFEKVEKLTPIGFGASTSEGGLLNRIYVPNDVMTWISEFSAKMNSADEFGEEPEEDSDRPRF